MAIKWHLEELMDEARLTYRELRSASGISTEIMARMIKEEDSAASSRTVDKLLEALQPHISRRLTTNDLQEWVGTAEPAAQPAHQPPAVKSLEAALERQKLGFVLTVEERTLIRNARAMGQV